MADSVTAGDSVDNLSETQDGDEFHLSATHSPTPRSRSGSPFCQDDVHNASMDKSGGSSTKKPTEENVYRERKKQKLTPVDEEKIKFMSEARSFFKGGDDSGKEKALAEYHYGIAVAKSLQEMSEYGRDWSKAEIQKILLQGKYMQVPPSPWPQSTTSQFSIDPPPQGIAMNSSPHGIGMALQPQGISMGLSELSSTGSQNSPVPSTPTRTFTQL